ncbi:mitochondrial adenine nucleotide transporter ADNT1-like [Arachis hypogaea]|uniref:mitochondrial adenine nucleotide transporter ADNT1-like n=1 Tax=Arachis hypogaea TaxID=3818 RepID=UPI003B21249E
MACRIRRGTLTGFSSPSKKLQPPPSIVTGEQPPCLWSPESRTGEKGAASPIAAVSFFYHLYCSCISKKLEMDFGRGSQLTPVLHLGAGACAGIIAMSATYPMDMVRGRITVQVPL